MKLALTDGMDGTAVISILADVKRPDSILDTIFRWKADPEHKAKYKIEPYDRMVFSPDEKTIFVDFGDYMTFFAIICETQDEYSDMSDAITGKKRN